MSRRLEPIIDPALAAHMSKGRRRSAVIRTFRAHRCSPAEIAAFLHVDVYEVRRTLRRPMRLRS